MPMTLTEIDEWDKLKGNDYSDLWLKDNRENTSNEFITVAGGIACGRVDFRFPFDKDEINIKYYYIQEVENAGTIQSRTYPNLNALAQYMNKNRPCIIRRDGRYVTFEFDNTTPVMSEQPEDYQGPEPYEPVQIGRSATTGFICIGVVYAKSKGWTKVHIAGSSEPTIHIPIPHTESRKNIELLLVSSGVGIGSKFLAGGVFRRDYPIVDPNDFTQFILHGSALYGLTLVSETDLEIKRTAGASDVAVQEVWWRFI